jgi:hypothetical protein
MKLFLNEYKNKTNRLFSKIKMVSKKIEKRAIEKVHMNIPIIIGKGRISHNEFNHHSIIIQKCYLTKRKTKKINEESTFDCNEFRRID